MPPNTKCLLSSWGGGGLGSKMKSFVGTLAQGLMWGVWKESYRRIFEEVKKVVWEVRDSILLEVGLWMVALNEFNEVSMNYWMVNWRGCIDLTDPPLQCDDATSLVVSTGGGS